MASTSTSVVRTAELGNGTRPSADRIYTTDQAVIVLDGASQPDESAHDGAWIADQLGAQLAQRLTDDRGQDLAAMLHDSIADIAGRHRLEPGRSPSTTVNIVRWHAGILDILVLCDSPVVIQGRAGNLEHIRDDRLSQLGSSHHATTGFMTDDAHQWRNLVADERRARNTPGGYWVAEATPQAAGHAIRARRNLNQVATVLAMTDGVANGIDRYGTPSDWRAAIDIARQDPSELVHVVHQAELSDPHGHRWPRSKRHDDKALTVVNFR